MSVPSSGPRRVQAIASMGLLSSGTPGRPISRSRGVTPSSCMMMPFNVSWRCGSMHVFAMVELDVLCHVCLFGFAWILDPYMSLIDVVCCALRFFYASRISLRFIRPPSI